MFEKGEGFHLSTAPLYQPQQIELCEFLSYLFIFLFYISNPRYKHIEGFLHARLQWQTRVNIQDTYL